MKANSPTFKTVDEYISVFPEPTQKILEGLRQTIVKAAPKCLEVISYNMPAIRQNGVVVYYAGYKNHIGFYPTGRGIAAFQKELSKYEGSKGTVRFPLDKPLPMTLISRIVKFRLKEDAAKAVRKKK